MRTSLVSAVLFTILFVAAFASTLEAAGSEAPNLSGVMEARKIVLDGENHEIMVSADKVFPKDRIEYTLRYRNVGTASASGVNLVGPIPPGTVYIDNTASSRGAMRPLFSIDGGATYHPAPVTYVAVNERGMEERRVATPDMYTHIMWNMERALAAGTEVLVSYRVQVK